MSDVLRPLNEMTAAEVLAEEGTFTNFIRALELSGVGDMLEKKGPHTVFAPTDDIFNEGMLGSIVGSARLEEALWHFIVPGKYVYKDLQHLKVLKTVGGYPLIISFRDGVQVYGAEIIKPDVPYNKGIIHEIANAERP